MPKTPEEQILIGKIRINSRHHPDVADEQRGDLKTMRFSKRIREDDLTPEQIAVAVARALTPEEVELVRALLPSVAPSTADGDA
jgi:hypothetical protein